MLSYLLWKGPDMNLLIVDDEYYSAESTRMKIARSDLIFDEIFCAYSMKQALEYLASHTIAIMILDIEMPGGSGLELLDHIRRNGLDTICIFLTAYAKFEYVSKAMRLTSIDYLLKPVDENDLLTAVSKAVEQYRRQANIKLSTLQASYFKESELYLWELFWMDLSADAVSSRKEDIVSELNLRKLNPAAADLSYLPLLIQCNGMDKVPLKKDLYEFLLKNIVREYFYKQEEIPVVVRMDSQFYFLPLPEAGRSREELLSLCSRTFADFVPRFPNTFNFYLPAHCCRIMDFRTTLLELTAAAERNVSLENHVFDLAQLSQAEDNSADIAFSFKDWNDLLLQRKTKRLLSETTAFLNSLQHSRHATKDTLTHFYYSFLQILFSCVETSNAEALPTFREHIAQLSVESACSSIQNLQEWISGSLNLYEECIVNSSDQDAAIKTIKDYIQSHLDENMTRESLAAIVYLTPDYLSHLFKRETGFSLTNYIIYERIEEAKRLLAGTGLSISDIATRCGFQNISYFSKQFKRFTGVTPREFRG